MSSDIVDLAIGEQDWDVLIDVSLLRVDDRDRGEEGTGEASMNVATVSLEAELV